MNRMWQCIIADFKQRTRQQSYAVVLLAMSVLTLLFFPSADAQYQTLVINGYRGIYNSAWLGVCLAMLNVMFLPIICFYLVKNALELDRQSMTCELIAATPVSKHTFLLSKWWVNVLILVSIVLVMLCSTVLIQLYYGESYQIDLWALAWPQLVFVLPLLLAIASIALMFESVTWLKGGLGNLVYFFIWIGSIVQTIESVSGIGNLLDQLDAQVAARFPLSQGTTNIGVSVNREVNTFVWQGIEPSFAHLLGVLPLLFISLICLVFAYIFFDRFSQQTMSVSQQPPWLSRKLSRQLAIPLDRLFAFITQHFAFTRLLRLELKLMLKSQSIFWFIGLIILNIIQVFISQQLLVGILLPLAWLWCVLVISPLGQLEKQSNTLELMAYSKQSSKLQTVASYSAAWILLAMASLAGIVRFMVMAEWMLLLQLIIAISFTVSLAYFCGAFSGTKRMFEVLYPTIWYLGPIQMALYVDFFGVNSQASWQAGMPYVIATISVGLLLLTVGAKNTR
ncbi:ABC-2 transporter permease [Shewanella livingstonensis]|uniref:Uncharacterized protein n=1 Tax=Shewanella livingstonensis TaxID=150120 RepID=A0A3G8LZJ5_9GAMM|nr:ABC-2 transporter permease [Shewanella livingstonensis]AZG74867.1 hypothetical protein EGC82_20215 [Shewanella livingstonensis]